jgi:hypothetical protein
MSSEKAHKFLDDVFGKSKELSNELKTDLSDESFIDLVAGTGDGKKFTADELREALKERLGEKGKTVADEYAVPLVRFSFSESPCR